MFVFCSNMTIKGVAPATGNQATSHASTVAEKKITILHSTAEECCKHSLIFQQITDNYAQFQMPPLPPPVCLSISMFVDKRAHHIIHVGVEVASHGAS